MEWFHARVCGLWTAAAALLGLEGDAEPPTCKEARMAPILAPTRSHHCEAQAPAQVERGQGEG